MTSTRPPGTRAARRREALAAGRARREANRIALLSTLRCGDCGESIGTRSFDGLPQHLPGCSRAVWR